MPRSELHDTKQKENIFTNPSIHCFADKCIRSLLPIGLNSTPPRILQKIHNLYTFLLRLHKLCETLYN